MNATKKVKRILHNFDEKDIDYTLLRNFDFLLKNQPYSEKDIDVLIKKTYLERVQKCFRQHNFKRLRLCPAAKHEAYVLYHPKSKKFISFHLHVGGVAGAHLPYLNAETLLFRKQKQNNICIVSNEDLILELILHSLLDGTYIKKKYQIKLNQLVKQKIDWEYIQKALEKIFNKLTSHKIIILLKNNNFTVLNKLSKNAKQYFKSKFLIKYIQIKIIKYAWIFYRLTRNSPLISFIGMDGTGKSTATNLIKKRLDLTLVKSALIYTGRGRNNILPIHSLGKLYFSRRNKKKRINSIQKKIEKNSLKKKIAYTLAAPVFALDLFLRYFFVILPKLKTKHIVITDRYSTDILLMANVPMFLKKILYFFFPKPTQTIYLYNTPAILHKRKKKHPIQDLYRQEKLFQEITRKIKPVKIKSKNVSQTLEEASKAIFDCL